jgi:hypothetical protein
MTEISIPTPDGTILKGTAWAAANPRAILVLVHGMVRFVYPRSVWDKVTDDW